MPLASVNYLSNARFKKQLLDFLKTWENAPLIGDIHSRDGAIHNDGVNIPTVGYGMNLLALTTSQVEKAFTYALTGKINGNLTNQQQNGIEIVTNWHQSASTGTTSANLSLISKSGGYSGGTVAKNALESIWLSDQAATRLLKAKLFGQSGLFETSIADQIESRLQSFGATMPKNSAEKLVLFSLYFNAPGLIGPGISAAIADNDHARFWYEVRYNHANTGFKGVQNRREAESDKVGILAPGDRSSLDKLLAAFDTLFDKNQDGTGVYDKILIRDATIKASDPANYNTESFSAQIAPYLATLAHKLANDRDLDFVTSGSNGKNTLRAGAAEHDGKTKVNTNDLLVGLAGSDRLFGGGGNDALIGGSGHDKLFGGNGRDFIKAGSGNDQLVGGKGNDLLIGQKGADTFIFAPHDGKDRIKDFQPGTDKLDLSDFNFRNKKQALSAFSEKGSDSDNQMFFSASGTKIIIKGADLDDMSRADLLI